MLAQHSGLGGLYDTTASNSRSVAIVERVGEHRLCLGLVWQRSLGGPSQHPSYNVGADCNGHACDGSLGGGMQEAQRNIEWHLLFFAAVALPHGIARRRQSVAARGGTPARDSVLLRSTCRGSDRNGDRTTSRIRGTGFPLLCAVVFVTSACERRRGRLRC